MFFGKPKPNVPILTVPRKRGILLTLLHGKIQK